MQAHWTTCNASHCAWMVAAAVCVPHEASQMVGLAVWREEMMRTFHMSRHEHAHCLQCTEPRGHPMTAGQIARWGAGQIRSISFVPKKRDARPLLRRPGLFEFPLQNIAPNPIQNLGLDAKFYPFFRTYDSLLTLILGRSDNSAGGVFFKTADDERRKWHFLSLSDDIWTHSNSLRTVLARNRHITEQALTLEFHSGQSWPRAHRSN